MRLIVVMPGLRFLAVLGLLLLCGPLFVCRDDLRIAGRTLHPHT